MPKCCILVGMSESDLPAVVPHTLFRPIWADPGFIMSINDTSVFDFTSQSGAVQRVAKNNPKRWAIGFLISNNTIDPWIVGPFPDPKTLGIVLSSVGALVWFNLFTHGPIVTQEWYGYAGGSQPLRVIEVEVG